LIKIFNLKGGKKMIVINNLAPIIALIFGILILIKPKLLSTLIALYLIITGLIGLGILNL